MFPDRRSPRRRGRWIGIAPPIALAVALAAGPLPAADAELAGADDRHDLDGTTTIVVEGVEASDLAQIQAVVGRRTPIEFLDELGAATVELPSPRVASAMSLLAARVDDATRISIDPVWSAFGVTPNDVDWADYQGSYAAAGLPDAWSATTGSPSTVIAVVDSGVNPVSELSGRVLSGFDFVDGDTNPADVDGHGTSSALVAAAAGNNSANGAGACWACLVLPVRVLEPYGPTRASVVAAGIVWATDNGADIINLSLGGIDRSTTVAAAIRYAAIRNVVIVAAAGNLDGDDPIEQRNLPVYPAAEPGVIAVAAAQTASSLYEWSHRGPYVDAAARGCNYSWSGAPPLDPDDFFFCGTSSAAPLVSGIVGLMRSIRPEANRAMVSNALRDGSPLLSMGASSAAAFVNAAVAVDRIRFAADGPERDNNPLDVSGPAVSIGNEASPGRVVSHTVRLSTNAADPAGISTWELLVDGQPNSRVAPGGGGVGFVDFDTTRVGDGTRSLSIRAIDSFGIESRTAGVPVVVDNTRPGLLVAAPGSGRGGRPVTVTVGVADANRVSATFLALGNQVVGGFVGAGVRQFPVVLPRSGRHRLVAASIDEAGNLSFSNQVYVTARRR